MMGVLKPNNDYYGSLRAEECFEGRAYSNDKAVFYAAGYFKSGSCSRNNDFPFRHSLSHANCRSFRDALEEAHGREERQEAER